MKTVEYNLFIDLISKQDCYFINSFENAAIRSMIDGDRLKFFVKFKGEEEFETKEGNRIVAGAFEEHTVISKEEYENY